MPSSSRGSDTIKILVATDNHVGYMERDAYRGEDSADTFDEVLRLAKERDVDMILLAGDLFHDNRPSRKSLVRVTRSIRMHCLGDKPCELEIIGDQSAVFTGIFDHANYYDSNINVSIPIFSIHGNHDDPAGEGHYSALDVLSESGLLNYYGRTPESDNISVKPVLLQKGSTKLALFGLSNVRDERLFRTFEQGKVKFYRPRTDNPEEFFNLLSVHQNHYMRGFTDKNNLPEDFLPKFMDLVVWGHEHECKIEPRQNPEMGFYVMQPGSSVATSLIQAEAVQKHVSLVTITGKEFESEAIPLKTVRPFVYEDIKLLDEPSMKKVMKKNDNKEAVREFLRNKVSEMIEQANGEWLDLHKDDEEPSDPPLPLIRLRVDYTAIDSGHFDIENPQRFSAFFTDRVANTTDIISFSRKKTAAKRAMHEDIEKPDLSDVTLENLRVDKLVREYLSNQALTILPQNSFGQTVQNYIEKGDKGGIQDFIQNSLSGQIKYLMGAHDEDEQAAEDEQHLQEQIDDYRSKQEAAFERGEIKLRTGKGVLLPEPPGWDEELDGRWEDQPGAYQAAAEEDANEDEASRQGSEQPSRGTGARGRGRGRATKSAASTRGAKATSNGRATKSTTTSKRAGPFEVDDDDSDIQMISSEDDFDPTPAPARKAAPKATEPARTTTRASKSTAASETAAPPAASRTNSKPASRTTSTRQTATSTRQTQLNFSQPSTQTVRASAATRRPRSDDEIYDSDDDAFESAPTTRR